jgi:hypothetical protein
MSKVVVLYDYCPSDRARKCTQESAASRQSQSGGRTETEPHRYVASISTMSCRLESGAACARSHAGSCARKTKAALLWALRGHSVSSCAGAPLLAATATQQMSDRRTGEFGVSKIIWGL